MFSSPYWTYRAEKAKSLLIPKSQKSLLPFFGLRVWGEVGGEKNVAPAGLGPSA